MKAVILASGYATRLYPLTINKTKALLDIAGKPIIEQVIQKIPKGITDICIITNSKFKKDFDEWLKNFSCGRNLRLIDDGSADNSNRLGSIGDLDFAVKNLGMDDLLVIASDNLFDFKIDKALEFFKAINQDTLGVYDTQNKEEARKLGVVELQGDNEIKWFYEKPAEPKSPLVSTGIYFFTKDSVSLVEEYINETHSREGPGLFIEWLLRKKKVYGFPLKGRWYDIGSIESYKKAREEWARKS